MAWGEITAEIVIVAGIVVAGTWLVWVMIRANYALRRVRPAEPKELRRAAKASPGRGADQTARTQVRTSHIAHDSGGSK